LINNNYYEKLRGSYKSSTLTSGWSLTMVTANCTLLSPTAAERNTNETGTSSQPPTFHPFPRLPTERRLKIWSVCHNLEPPKKLRFSYRHGGKRQPARALEGCFSSLDRSLPKKDIPTILHTCHKSRNHFFAHYSVAHIVSPNASLIERGVRESLEEISHEEAIRRGFHDIFWNKRKDVMWIDGYWLDDNLRAFLWSGRFDIKFPGVRWLVFNETTTVSFVQDRAISWKGIETVFVVREPLVVGSARGVREEREAWGKKFGERGEEEKEIGGKERQLPELQIVSSWKDVLEYLHQSEVW
jgi:2EXR family